MGWLERQPYTDVAPWCEVKRRQGHKITLLYSIIRLGVRDAIRTTLQKLRLTGTVQTAYLERSNLTLREHVAPLARRTWSLVYDQHHLRLHIQWALTYYHFVRSHQSLEVCIRSPGQPRYRTPAMAVGLTSQRWTVADVLMMPVPGYGARAPFPVV
jgi:transposase InsO family protein